MTSFILNGTFKTWIPRCSFIWFKPSTVELTEFHILDDYIQCNGFWNYPDHVTLPNPPEWGGREFYRSPPKEAHLVGPRRRTFFLVAPSLNIFVELRLAPTLTLFCKTLKICLCQQAWGPHSGMEHMKWLI